MNNNVEQIITNIMQGRYSDNELTQLRMHENMDIRKEVVIRYGVQYNGKYLQPLQDDDSEILIEILKYCRKEYSDQVINIIINKPKFVTDIIEDLMINDRDASWYYYNQLNIIFKNCNDYQMQLIIYNIYNSPDEEGVFASIGHILPYCSENVINYIMENFNSMNFYNKYSSGVRYYDVKEYLFDKYINRPDILWKHINIYCQRFPKDYNELYKLYGYLKKE